MSTDLNIKELMAQQFAAMAEQAREELERSSDLIARFTKLAATKGVVLDSNAFSFIPTIGIVANAPGLALTLLGPLQMERDGLLPYEDICARFAPSDMQSGYFIGADYMLMAHPCYRREMHPEANWAPRFIDVFCAFDRPTVKKFIAIDENRVRLDVDGMGYFEADTWYGAPFDDDVRKIKSGTAKLRPPMDIDPNYVNFFFARTHCLDIKWSEADGIKTFQALEIKTDDVQVEMGGETYYPARYLHAEFDIDANCFRHFDGAIQYFREDEYFRRRDSDFNMVLKDSEHIKAKSKKVFKLNGPIPTKAWVDLCCHFYPANPLTFEYFTGSYPQHLVDTLSKIRSRKHDE
ncbi:hypothetical protein J2X04_001507 [Lysobacter niabensis]|uniref:Uncharacterized protein n=1 Tax=Agrilutibacter niabensis TaxID=380628 RepID=A0ABU1VNV3_9GAMM|nr:hypothetical protein [Lysobacter niabensis]MDR7099160.1 hypothetical protein [Lysobacter niabensis]